MDKDGESVCCLDWEFGMVFSFCGGISLLWLPEGRRFSGQVMLWLELGGCGLWVGCQAGREDEVGGGPWGLYSERGVLFARLRGGAGRSLFNGACEGWMRMRGETDQ